MDDEPVTDELLTEWESHASVGINTSATTSALIAEVRALRAQEGELRDAVEHQRGMYEREHNTVHELQQRIDKALAPLDRWGGGVRGISLLDLPGLIRTALTETQSGPDQLAADQGRTGLGKDGATGC